MADGKLVRQVLFTETRCVAEDLDKNLQQSYEGRDLSKTSLWCRLVSPDVNDFADFDYMGRDLTRQVKDYILAPLQNPYRIKNPNAMIKHITGMPGCGKTVSTTAAVGQLHVESKKASQAAQVAATGHGGRWDRFLLMSGAKFKRNPNETFYKSLIMAFINDEVALASLKDMDYDRDEFYSFLQGRKEILHVIVDDGNAMDDSEDALSFLLTLTEYVFVTVCGSIGSKLRQQLLKVRMSEYLLITDGFSDDELDAFLTHNGKTRQDLMIYKTGMVPRLVDEYLNNTGSFYLTIKWHKKLLRDFIYGAKGQTYEDLLVAVGGGRIDKLSSVLDSRCYFRGSRGKARCLTDYLHSRANCWMAQVVTATNEQKALDQLEHVLSSIRLESNKALIGWSAETAVILTLRLLGIHLDLGNTELNIKPSSVSVFKKKMTKSRLRGPRHGPMLYLPAAFNNAGLDAYYEDDECLLVFQITISLKPEQTHISTAGVAEALFDGDNRIKVLVWVTYQQATKVVPPSTDRPYYELFLTFRDLHGALAVIDETLKKIRGSQANCCRVCKLPPDFEAACASCGWWFHESCYGCSYEEGWLCPDCVVIHEDVDTDGEEDSSDDYDSHEQKRDLSILFA